MIASMTGYARADGSDGGLDWTWELRSVNGRGLDVRARLPAPFDRLDSDLRQRIAGALARGNVSVTLTVRTAVGEDSPVTVNEDLLARLMDVSRRHIEPGDAPPRPELLLGVRGVVELAQADARPADLEVPADAMLASLSAALVALVAARREEGARLHDVLADRIAAVSREVADLRAIADRQTMSLRDRYHQQIAELLDGQASPVPDERLAHEVALLATKADIREELDRLDAHVAQAETLLASGEPSGRRLDFLCQELNREANTICSKAADLQVTRAGLELKAVIDQIKEQVQNVE